MKTTKKLMLTIMMIASYATISASDVMNNYAYTFTNNAPFAVIVQSPDLKAGSDDTITINPRKQLFTMRINSTATSAPQYSLIPLTNISASSPQFKDNPYRFEKSNSQNGQNAIVRRHFSAPKENASYDIVTNTYNSCYASVVTSDCRKYNEYQDISLTKTSDSGKIYTNKTGYTIRMTSKPKKHKDWKSFNLEPGQSTGKASNDGMERVHIYVPKAKNLPKASAAVPSLAPGKYAINYDKATNQLSLDLVA